MAETAQIKTKTSFALSELPQHPEFVGKPIREDAGGCSEKPLSRFVCDDDGSLKIFVRGEGGKEECIGGVGKQGSAELQGNGEDINYLYIGGPYAPTFLLWLD